MVDYRFKGEKLSLSDEEWKKRLTPEQYRILRKAGTEPPFENEYADSKKSGIYLCAGCGLPLYSSDAKFDSGSGWPSFTQPISPENVSYSEDNKLLSTRTEVLCSKCNSHLGHVSNDGPKPTGQRYCMNSGALKFHAE